MIFQLESSLDSWCHRPPTRNIKIIDTPSVRSHYDPKRTEFGALRVLNDDLVQVSRWSSPDKLLIWGNYPVYQLNACQSVTVKRSYNL